MLRVQEKEQERTYRRKVWNQSHLDRRCIACWNQEWHRTGKTAKGYIDQGQLIPDELMIDILASVFDSFKDSKEVIFDGFPRTIAQAEALKKMLAERGQDVSVMVDLDVRKKNWWYVLLNVARIPVVLMITKKQSRNAACISFTDCSTDRLVQERKEIPTHQRLGYYGRYLRWNLRSSR